jgi:hypothetical protein
MSAPERMMPPVIFADPRGVWDIPTDERTNEGQVMFWRHDRCIPLTAPALVEVREALYSCLGALKAAGVQFWPEEEARAALAKLDALMKQQGGA